MNKIVMIALSLALCGVLFGGCRRNVGTDSQATTTAPTAQATTETAPTIVPTVPAPTDILPDNTDVPTGTSDDLMPGVRRPMEHHPMPHR